MEKGKGERRGGGTRSSSSNNSSSSSNSSSNVVTHTTEEPDGHTEHTAGTHIHSEGFHSIMTSAECEVGCEQEAYKRGTHRSISSDGDIRRFPGLMFQLDLSAQRKASVLL